MSFTCIKKNVIYILSTMLYIIIYSVIPHKVEQYLSVVSRFFFKKLENCTSCTRFECYLYAIIKLNISYLACLWVREVFKHECVAVFDL